VDVPGGLLWRGGRRPPAAVGRLSPPQQARGRVGALRRIQALLATDAPVAQTLQRAAERALLRRPLAPPRPEAGPHRGARGRLEGGATGRPGVDEVRAGPGLTPHPGRPFALL